MSNYIFNYNKNLLEISQNKNESFLLYLKFCFVFIRFYLKKNWLFSTVILTIIGFFKGKYILNILTFFLCALSAYLFHMLAHKNDFMNIISGHSQHHKNKNNIIDHLKELVSDMFAAGGYLLLINIVLRKQGCAYLNNQVIIYFMLSFPMIHLFNYHNLIEKSYHYYHHKRVNTNFSPDIFDHLFSTNDGPYFENLNHMIPIFLIIGVILIVLDKNGFFK